MNRELPDVQARLRKGRGTRDQIANILWIMEKAREFQKNRKWRTTKEPLDESQGIFPTQGWNPHLLHWQADYIAQNNLEHRDGISLCSKISAQLTKIPLFFWIPTLTDKDVASGGQSCTVWPAHNSHIWMRLGETSHSWPIQMPRLCLGNPETGGVGIRILEKTFMN